MLTESIETLADDSPFSIATNASAPLLCLRLIEGKGDRLIVGETSSTVNDASLPLRTTIELEIDEERVYSYTLIVTMSVL